jgi:formylglycine-generating enzyme required for sulfatase activity
VPAGEFMMGSPVDENGRYSDEDDGDGQQHKVTIARPFAVSKFDVTFADWDACVSVGGLALPFLQRIMRSSSEYGCPQAEDPGWGRGTQPVIYVSWHDAQVCVAWLSMMTGKTYRLLTEAEWEYAARAGTQTAYFWGNETGKENANCVGCGSRWDGRQTSPVGSFKPNPFGLFDMAGNVSQWVQDCYHENYNGASMNGSAWTAGDCRRRVVRGGSWLFNPQLLRSATRNSVSAYDRGTFLGFRVARTLTP